MTRKMSLIAVCCSKRFRQGPIARLHLLEKARVFDRDHRLVGKALHQLHLTRVNGRRSSAANTPIDFVLRLSRDESTARKPPMIAAFGRWYS